MSSRTGMASAADPALPINSHREEIARAIAAHPVVVVCGETGSGKSTQLPQICLAIGRGTRGRIGQTQPRRIAARSVAARIAQELGSPLGKFVGYKIRFNDTTSPDTRVKVMTDGILLAETQQDRFLKQYDTIILDEAHERSLNVDFLIGYLKRLLPKRRDLRLIITSATLDVERFASHYCLAGRTVPIVQVAGQTYPVEVRYRPLSADDGEAETDLARGIGDAIDELSQEGPGDILVFLPTERDIRDVAKNLRGRTMARGRQLDILPLYGRLSTAEQNRVFQVSSRRRVVLATNVAESSLTVPGIHYVIDSGTARISRYSPRSKVQRLPIEPVSQASADQRRGRCGRTAPGICIRLYREDDYLRRDRFSLPEIRRTNLASVVLQMLALRLGEVDRFPFLDPPRTDAIRDGYRTLFELGAVDARRQLTDVGRQLSRLPVDPRIGRMLLAAHEEQCLNEVLVIASVLEIQDPRERPAEKESLADERHAQFRHEASDFLTYLQLWDLFHRWKEHRSRSQLRKICQENFLSFSRMREWQDIHRQLLELVQATKMRPGPRRNDEDAIHRALLTGLLSNIAIRREKYEYQGADGGKFFLWPGSAAFAKRPRWVMAGELLETQRRYLRTVAPIQSRWIEPLANHLVRRTHQDPYWAASQGTVLAHEKVTLFGLTIVSDRRVPFGPLDPEKSRELFIQHGLVEGNLRFDWDFHARNRQLVKELHGLGARLRNSDYMVPDRVIFEFYDRRLPEDVYDVASLRRWLRTAPREESDRLVMQRGDVLASPPDAPAREAFPETVAAGPMNLPIEYRFQPGDQDDGLTLTVPREAINQLEANRLEWLVPGLLEEKLKALIRTLPKSIRRNLVPAPDRARQAAERLRFGEGNLLQAAADTLGELAGEQVPAEAFDLEKLPSHLRMNVRVLDAAGAVIAHGRDLGKIKQALGIRDSVPEGMIRDPRYERDGIRRWDFGELPERVEVRRGPFDVPAYPALVDRHDHVSLCLMDNPCAAARALRAGLRRLVVLAESHELKSQVQWLPHLNEIQLWASTLGHQRDVKQQITDLLAQRAFVEPSPRPHTAEDFAALRQEGNEHVLVVVQEVTSLLPPLFETYHEAQCALDDATSALEREAAADVREQLAMLVPEGFLAETPWQWLLHFPRYFRGMRLRLERLRAGSHARDSQATRQLAPLWRQYIDRFRRNLQRSIDDPDLDEYRWMLEEYRVSLFAQTLGTSMKVSPQRLARQWAKVR